MFIKLIYKEISKCFYSYISKDKVREYLQRLINVPVSGLTFDQYYEEIKSTLSVDYDGVKENAKIKELRKKIISLMKKYNKAKIDENNLKSIFSGTEKFVTCQKELFDSVLLLSNYDISFMGEGIVRQNSSSKNRYLLTFSVSSCIVTIIRDSQSKRSVLAHISPDSDAEKTQQQLLRIFQENDIPLYRLEVTILGGWKSQFSSFNTAEAIRSFWEEKTEVQLDTTYLYKTNCFELPIDESNAIIGQNMIHDFGQEVSKDYIAQVTGPSQGIIYSRTRSNRIGSQDKNISKCIELTIKKSLIDKGILQEEVFTNFPIELVHFIHNSKNTAEKKLTISLFGYPGCCLQPIIFDTETGCIAISEIYEAYVLPIELQESMIERYRERSSRNIDELEFRYDILSVEQRMSAMSEPGPSILGRSIASAISASEVATTSSVEATSIAPGKS